MNPKLITLLSKLIESRKQAHIFHLQTQSFSEHKALQEYYEGIESLYDELVESLQGEFGIIKGYQSFPTLDYENKQTLITFFKGLSAEVTEFSKIMKESYILNQLDEIQQLLKTTIYKIWNLS